jgi:superfamily II DNA/RNA helicase
VDEVLSACPAAAQRALFSATLGPKVKELASSVLRDPLSISVGTPNAGAATIDQKLVFVGREDGKLLAIRQVSSYCILRYSSQRFTLSCVSFAAALRCSIFAKLTPETPDSLH